MYQKLDDLNPEADTPRPAWGGPQLWGVAAIIIVGLGLWVLWAVFRAVPDTSAPTPAQVERSQYHIALTEPYPPLRRARLQDFTRTYPDSARQTAVAAQLDVLSAREALDWAALSEILYDPETVNADKRTAISAYERAWGPSFLGGRHAEITRLRQAFAADTDDQPDRTLPNNSPISEDITDTDLVGGPQGVLDRSLPSVAVLPPLPPLQTVAPRVRRSVTPTYPKRALRKDIEAVVTLSLNINDKGKVVMASLVSVTASDFEKDFVKAAQRAARRTRYFPKTVNGVPQPASGVVKRYRFELGD